MDDAALRAAGYQRALKVYVAKSAGAAPLYLPPCWVRVRGLRVDVAFNEPFNLEQAQVMALTATLDRCVIGWAEGLP